MVLKDYIDNYPKGNIKTKDKSINIKDLDKNIYDYLYTLEPEYQEMLLATSGNDGGHTEGSRHFKNKAIDLRFKPELYNRIKNDPKRLEYGVTLLDPKHGTAPHLHLSVGKGSENKKDVWIDPYSDKAKTLYTENKDDKVVEQEDISYNSTAGTTQQADNIDNSKQIEREVEEIENQPMMLDFLNFEKIQQLELDRQEKEKALMEQLAIQTQKPEQEVREEIPQEFQQDPIGFNPYEYINIEEYKKGGTNLISNK